MAARGETFRAEVRVELKPGVTDPEGANAMKTLELLGFGGVRGVKAVHSYVIDLAAASEKAARSEAEEMAKRLLANPVIHNTRITIQKGK
ncbi:MAG: phosphoribosylformylglycinamidine synthase subunit PurS [Thermoplasmatota archaeon]